MRTQLQFIRTLCVSLMAVSVLGLSSFAQEENLKALGRFEGWRDNALIGYGLVVGLSGSGDSRQSEMTRQALSNVLGRLGTSISQDDISSRNVAAVLVIGTLPPSANLGDKISVTVSSAGDARSLAGGTLLMTPMLAPNQQVYALAQGPLVTGGYSFESQSNLQQRNYPTTARLEMGATVERPVDADLKIRNGELSFLLNDPGFTTAQRIAASINKTLGSNAAWAKSADEVRIKYAGGDVELTNFISIVENVAVVPDRMPRIVINERTGTIVAGSDVKIASIVISQGDIRVSVTADNYASQPSFIGGFASDIQSLVVTNTQLDVSQGDTDAVRTFPNTTIADLVQGLNDSKVDTRRIISILQAIKSAGALNAEIIVQ